MKKSIFKKLVSVVSVLAMVISCTATVFADYECASQSSTCDDKTNWTEGGHNTGYSQKVEGGVFKSVRTAFRTYYPGRYGLAEGDNPYDTKIFKETWVMPDGNGGWKANESQIGNVTSVYKFANGKSFAKGKVQAKFDFKFNGTVGQGIGVGLQGATNAPSNYVGVRIHNTDARAWYPTDLTSNPIYYNKDQEALTPNKWYTCLMQYDIDLQVLKVTITDDDGMNFTFTDDISENESDGDSKWGSRTPGAIQGLSFSSYRDIDIFGTIGETGSSEPGSSEWCIDNIELDAGVGYKAENVYSSGDGLKTEAVEDGFNFDGIKLSRLTRIADPANTSFVTAAYAGDGRMTEAVATPLSQIGTTPINADITGASIKSFVLGMDTATPYMAPYTYTTSDKTVRKVDFEDNFRLNTFDSGSLNANNIANLAENLLHGHAKSAGYSMSVVNDNGNNVLKSERSYFRSSSGYWRYDGETNAFVKLGVEPKHGFYFVRMGKDATQLEGWFRVKFNGSDFSSALQGLEVNLGNDSSAVGEYFLRFFRKADGSGEIRSGFGTTVLNLTAGQLNENEWYNVHFTFNGTTLNADLTGRFGTGTTITTKNGSAKDSTMKGKTFDYVAIGSHRDWDYAVSYAGYPNATPTASTRNTSVYYIDDIRLEY